MRNPLKRETVSLLTATNILGFLSQLLMYDWLEIALVAYLVGASIEGVNTFKQLYHSLPELVKDEEDDQKEPAPPIKSGSIFAIIAAVSIAGACSWPCRLIHRSMKADM